MNGPYKNKTDLLGEKMDISKLCHKKQCEIFVIENLIFERTAETEVHDIEKCALNWANHNMIAPLHKQTLFKVIREYAPVDIKTRNRREGRNRGRYVQGVIINKFHAPTEDEILVIFSKAVEKILLPIRYKPLETEEYLSKIDFWAFFTDEEIITIAAYMASPRRIIEHEKNITKLKTLNMQIKMCANKIDQYILGQEKIIK